MPEQLVPSAGPPLQSGPSTSPAQGEHASAETTGGRFLDRCRIDLPLDDVVEEIEFERFFRLDRRFGDLHPEKPAPTNADHPPELAEVNILDLPMALYMPFTQQWRLDGYSRGRVVNSFSLGPSEEQTVEIFTWDRKHTAFESSTSFEADQSTESSGSRRDTTDVSHDIARQAGLELTSDGKVGFKVGVADVNLSAGMTARAGVNEAEHTTRSLIVDATSRATGRVRTGRTLKVTESREAGREERVTRKLRNPNTCHTLTVPFFEVLANYHVSTFVLTPKVRLVVLIESSQLNETVFDRQAVRVHETTLRLALLDRTLAPGLDAARLLDSRDRACSILCGGCSCADDKPNEADGADWDAVVAAARAIADAVDKTRARSYYFPASVGWSVPAPVGFGFTPDIVTSGLNDIKRYLFKEALAAAAPRLISDLAAVGLAGGLTATVSASQARAIHTVVTTLPPTALPLLHFSPRLADQVGVKIYAAVLLFHPEFLSAGVIAAQVRSAAGDLLLYDDAGLLGALTAFESAYDAWTKRQIAAHLGDEKRAELARIANEERDLRILESYGLRETADAEERLQALLDHLNDNRNRDHYRFAVWNERSGAADDKLTLLALAGLIDPTPVGIVGNQLAVPVRLEHEKEWADFFAEGTADLVKNTARDERRHILPTAALYAEAVVGECCACEEAIVTKQQHEAEEARLRNELLRLEKNRLELRLDASPPRIDKEYPPPSTVCVSCGSPCHCDRPAGTAEPGGVHAPTDAPV